LVMHQRSETFATDTTMPDMFMAVHTRAKRLLRIVQVNCYKTFEPDNLIEPLHRFAITVRRTNVISSGKNMTRIDTYHRAIGIFDTFNNFLKLFKTITDNGSLPCCCLENTENG